MEASALPLGMGVADEKGVTEQTSSTKKYFSVALFCATVIPFFIGWGQYFHVSETNGLQRVIYILAGIHVPLTVYLFFDPAIRNQVWGTPVRFIAVPVLLFAVCLFLFLGSTPAIMTQKAEILTYFMLGVLSWNFWHFGKQNIGVWAYYRLSITAGGMLPVERILIYLGAFLGAISVFFIGTFYQTTYSQNVHLGNLIYLSGYICVFGKYFQYVLASFTLYHILRNHSRFDWKSALMFFLCVNYFLPAYLSLDWQRWFSFFIASSSTHGAQYIVFLFFHSYNARHSMPASKPAPPKRPGSAFVATHIYVIILAILVTAFYVSYTFYQTSINNLRFTGKTPDAYWASCLDALATGVLLTHFWLDSFFWKFKNRESRNWLLERYNFLFKPARDA